VNVPEDSEIGLRRTIRVSHRMKILTILAATLVLNLFDASNCRADETATEAMLRTESLGGLRLGLPEKAVLKLLGPPATRDKLVLQEADGNYVQHWDYPDKGIELSMSAGGKKSGVKTIAHIYASAPCTFATRKGIKIGDAESAARKAYTEHVDRESSDPGTLVVGSVYGGIIFNFTKGKVSSIFFGAAAE
jgi:hypothetical protein